MSSLPNSIMYSSVSLSTMYQHNSLNANTGYLEVPNLEQIHYQLCVPKRILSIMTGSQGGYVRTSHS